jgi:biotin transport system substrate-specific component
MTNTHVFFDFADSTEIHTKFLSLFKVVACSLFIALCAQIRIPLFFTPIPITLQTFAVMLVAYMLGARHGTLSVLLYIAEATLGLPVLAGKISNPMVLFSITGGYLIGFAIQAYIAGIVIEKKKELGKELVFTGLLLASSLQLICGGLWLSHFVGWENTLIMGIVPFIPGEILKVVVFMTFVIYHRNEQPSEC